MGTVPQITVNLSVTEAGAQPTSPVTLWTNLITLVAQYNPGYTILPAGLIEDLASTATYAIALLDAAAVELINSMTPFSANPWLITQLGSIYGVPQGVGSNTSVFVVFSGTVGFPVPVGFLVSDGTHTYALQEGTVIGGGGSSSPAFCLATQPGTWAVPAGTVNVLGSSVPGAITLTVTNPLAGTPSPGPQTQAEYDAQVLAAGLVSGQGNTSMFKTLVQQVSGVQGRLVSVRQVTGGWEVLVGGGDPYEVANAIVASGLDISVLQPSVIGITAVTKANPGVATTDLNHGLVTGQANVNIAGALGMTSINGGSYAVIVLDEKRFSFGIDTTGAPTYTGGGVVTPNARNISVNLYSYPDTYEVLFVEPPGQPVTVQLTWNTISPNFVSASSVQQLGAPAIAAYINSVAVGQPINLFSLEAAFVASVLSLFNNNAALISKMSWTVSINGVDTPPDAGTFLIYGDPESYFTCAVTDVTCTQG